MDIFKLKHSLLALTILVTIAACGGGGGGSSSGGDDATGTGTAGVSANVGGSAVKGIVIRGIITARELDSAGNVLRIVGTAETGADGGYSLTLNASYQGGPIEISLTAGPDTTTVCDVDTGCGNRNDGLTSADDPRNNDDGVIDFGEQYKPSANLSMTALLGGAQDGETIAVQVTPYTHLAAKRAKSAPLTANSINNANSEVSVLLGGVDILRTRPVDITNPASRAGASAFDIVYSGLAAAIAKQAPRDADNQPNIIQALIDFSDAYAASGFFDSVALQVILNNASGALGAAGVTDTSGVLASIQDVVDNAMGGPIDPEPNPNVGDSDVQKARLFLSDLRTWGTVISAELDSPSEAFANQVELAQAAADVILQNNASFEALSASTEVISEIGVNGGNCGRGNAIAFDDVGAGTGTLYWTDGTWISQLDKASGALIGTARVFLDYSAFGPPPENDAGFRVVAMDFHPITGELYAAVQQRQAQSSPPARSTLAKLDPATGTFTLIGVVDGTGVKLDGIAFNAEGTLYGTSTGYGTGEQGSGGSGGGGGPGTGPGQRSQFHMVDTVTGVATEISMDIGYDGDVGGLAANAAGVLYAGSGGRGPNSLGRSEDTSVLFTINPATGLGNAAIGPLGIEYGPPESSGQGPGEGNFWQFGSLRQNISGWSFDPVSGDLYGMTGRGAQLFVANTATGLATRVGSPCTDFIDRETDHGTFTGNVVRTGVGDQSLYTLTDASVDVFGDMATVDLVASLPNNFATLSTVTVGIESGDIDSDSLRLVINSGIVSATLVDPAEINLYAILFPDDFFFEDDGIEDKNLTMAEMDLDVEVTQKQTLVNGLPETATDPITFAGRLAATIYTVVLPSTGEPTGEFIPGSLGLGGTISNSMGDSVDVNFTLSIPTAAADALSPEVLPGLFEFGSTYAENNGGSHLIYWSSTADQFFYESSNEFYYLFFDSFDGSVYIYIDSPRFSEIVDVVDPGPYASLADFASSNPFMPLENLLETVEGQGVYQKTAATPDYSQSGFAEYTLVEQIPVVYGESNPPIGSVGLQFSAQFDGLPEALVNITGSTTGFEQGEAMVTLSYDNRMIQFSGSNNTPAGEVGQFDITNQDGVTLTLDFANDALSDLSINGRVIATVEELSSGAIKVSYIDGTFEIF